MNKKIGTKVNVKVWNGGPSIKQGLIIGYGVQDCGPHHGEPCYVLRFNDGIEGSGYTDFDFA